MASKEVYTFNSHEPSMGEAEIFSLLEVALKLAGGKSYYYVSGKEDLFTSLSIKVVECQQNAFLPLSKTYEERNELKNTEFQFGGDYTGSDSREEQVNSSAEGSFNGRGAAVGGNASASVRKKSRNKHVMNSKPIPPRSTLRRETGHITYTCKVELSVNINCEVIFSNWRWYNWVLSSSNDSEKSIDPEKSDVRTDGYMKTVSAEYVLSKVNGWDENTKTATIKLECLVETERNGIYSLDKEIDNQAVSERQGTSNR